MGALLGVGLSHFPPLCYPDSSFAAALRWTLQDPDLPDPLRDPSGWPEAMRAEWADDAGAAAAARHREALVRRMRPGARGHRRLRAGRAADRG